MNYSNDNVILDDPINRLAREKFGIDYVFPYQRLVISNIFRAASVKGFETDETFNDELSPGQIVLLPTGAGKSLCFMLPSLILKGITLVIFPLLSLMSDQQRRTDEAGISSVILRGGQSSAERDRIFKECRSGRVKMILTNPETILNKEVLEQIKKITISHLVLDETHIVSEWGETFRPAYLEIDKLIYELNIDLVTAFTATASKHILKKVKEVIFPGRTPNIIYANPDRQNISYSVIPSISPSKTLIEQVELSEKPLIIFSSSRTGTELTARFLRTSLKSEDIFFYHAGLSKEEKKRIERWFFTSDNGILVATCAYGLGVDKANIRTVIHINLPTTVESYLQESGRAGRDRKKTNAMIIYSDTEQKRIKDLNNSLTKERFLKMINYAENNKTCRREILLAMLDSEPEICSGCDVCNNSVADDLYKKFILNILNKNKRRMTVHDAVYFFKGYKSRDIKNRQLYRIAGFGSLKNWEPDFIREALQNLILLQKIRLGKGIFWRGYITN